MSKKKMTLKDLDEFLKQQAATLVTPEKLSEKIETPAPEVKPVVQTPQSVAAPLAAPVSSKQLIDELKAFASQEGEEFRVKFYDIILSTLEAQPESLPEDKMLINTVLYLKHGDQWKEAIRAYWRKH
jgi:hypothetical protein